MDDVRGRQLAAGMSRGNGAELGWLTDRAQQPGVPGRHPSLSLESGPTHTGPYTAPSVFGSFDAGAIAGSIEESSTDALAPAPLTESPTEVAESGFQGARRALPHRAELEASFGVPLDDVEAYVDDKAQAATSALGAHAFASGNRVAFATSDPDPALVAHELTHVLQHTGMDDEAESSDRGIDTGGEAEAEAVEAAVAAGKPARAALARRRTSGRRSGGVRRKPALSSPFCSRMSFSPTGLEQSGVYRFWSGAGINVPIPAVPGLSFVVSPSVSLVVGGGVDWSQEAVHADLNVDGSVGLGFSYGMSSLAKIFAGTRAIASGGGTYERTRASTPAAQAGAGAQSQEASTRAANNWTLEAGLDLGATFVVSMTLGGGILEKRLELGTIEVGSLAGIRFDNGRMNRDLAWTWGSSMEALFAEVQGAIDQAQRIMAMPAELADEAWQGLARAGGWAYHGVEAAGRAIRNTYGGAHATPGADASPSPLDDPFVWGF